MHLPPFIDLVSRASSEFFCRAVSKQTTTMIEYSCTLRRSSSCGLCAPLSCLPTPPSSQCKLSKFSRRYSQFGNYCEGCSMHIASLLQKRSQITRQRIECMIDNAKLTLEILSASCCILESLPLKFYCRLELSLSDPSILGEIVLISAFMVSSKYLEDETWRLSTWASVCDRSIASADLRVTELQMLTELNFDIARIVTLEAVERTISEFRSRQFCIDFLQPVQIHVVQRSPVMETPRMAAPVYLRDHFTSYGTVIDFGDDDDEQFVTVPPDAAFAYLSGGYDTSDELDSSWFALAPTHRQVG
ncbi:hypothetical protein V1520DRAFT_224500 [Lipomyces starkeyi]|uniref:Cyclin N-terminal domain-containing protein n=1 Tax=Lipomyces starkeyi NRRL Y-11557 TaxID=675824 RepID=A0A1E3Q4E0_LIPST|nr:hypothetical protein LIPSTDRAFT_111694 [Lipomyces starkeyi NRRL Y-11557]